jgi:tetratricopeptide (TPR) repeat protein
MLGWAAQERGDSAQALALMSECVTLMRQGGHSVASSLRSLGRALMREGDYEQATGVLQESLAELREERASERIPPVLNLLGEATLARGDYVAARACFQECWTLCRELGNAWDMAGSQLGEGHVALAAGDTGAANASYTEALQLFTSLPDWDDRRRRISMAVGLEGLAGAVAHTDPERATRLYGATVTLRATDGQAVLDHIDDGSPLPGNRAAVRDLLGEEAFSAAWAAGQALTLEQATAEALAGAEERGSAANSALGDAM